MKRFQWHSKKFSILAALASCLFTPNPLHAGLYYSGEQVAELPSQWRGFLADLRSLRSIAVKPTATLPASPMRKKYEDEVEKLQRAAMSRELTAAEIADLGALHIRLGAPQAALDVLRPGYRLHPQHFRIAANLGTAWQHVGDFDQAIQCLRQAVRLSPGKLQRAEEHHLKLLQLRRRERRGEDGLDDLFGVKWVNEKGEFEAGRLTAGEHKKLPSDAIALVQQLAIWLPQDARLLWQLGELANAHGDLKAAGDMFEICVGQFAMSSRKLREHRSIVRAALAAANREVPGPATAKAEHEGHAGRFVPKSSRPLAANRFDVKSLPAIDPDGVNALPWGLLLETRVDRHFRPKFADYLQELNGRQISITGFVQPITDEQEWTMCMFIEYPTGCWYCEMPEVTSILLLELADGKTMTYTRDMLKVTGRLSLNDSDPENFLYTIKEARVREVD